MSAIKIKKLTLQYSYLLLEKDDVTTICQQQEKKISEYIKDNHPEKYKQIYEQPQIPPEQLPERPPETEETQDKDLEENPKVEECEKEDTETQENKKNTKNTDLRTLYRKIASKTHPDKTGNDLMAREFSVAAAAYASNNLAALLNLAGYLNIECETLSEESVILLETNVDALSETIEKKKSTGAWLFYKAKTPEEKEFVIQKIMSHLTRR